MEYILYNKLIMEIKKVIKNHVDNINSSILIGGFAKLPNEEFQNKVIKLLNELKDYRGYKDLQTKLQTYKQRLINLDTKLGNENPATGLFNEAEQIRERLDPIYNNPSDPTDKYHNKQIIKTFFDKNNDFQTFIDNYKKFIEKNLWNKERIATDKLDENSYVYDLKDPTRTDIYIQTEDSIDVFNNKLKILFSPLVNSSTNLLSEDVQENINKIKDLLSISKKFNIYINNTKKNIENILFSSYDLNDIIIFDNSNNKINPNDYLINLRSVTINDDKNLNLENIYNIENDIKTIIQFTEVKEQFDNLGKINIFEEGKMKDILNIDNIVKIQTGGIFETKYYSTNSSKKLLELSKYLEKLFEILDKTLDDAKYLKQLQLRYNLYIGYLFLIIQKSASELPQTNDDIRMYEYLSKDKIKLYLDLLKEINNNFISIDDTQKGLKYLNEYHYLTINKLIKLCEILYNNLTLNTQLIKVLECKNNVGSDLILFNHFRLILVKFCESPEGIVILNKINKTKDDL
jgi:hypothetical protein